MADLTAEQQSRLLEVRRCRADLGHFINTYCQILASDDKGGAWAPFKLWPAQEQVAKDLALYREIVILKARQLGFTWLVLSFALQQLVFFPVATVLLFSKRDDEAVELLEFRLREMYRRLPAWMQVSKLTADKTHKLELPSGSRAMAFATTGGRSYTATLAVIDEADFVPDLEKMLNAIRPTVDAGGRLILLSTADKSLPESPFKTTYRAAKLGQNSYHAIFHGWNARPERTAAWHAEKSRAVLAETGALDNVQQEYPATDLEALAPRSLDKRIPAVWLQQCFVDAVPLDVTKLATCPAVPGLTVYAAPVPGRRYVLGGDPAEGNPTSDDSAACLLDAVTGEQVAELAGKFEPSAFAAYIYAVALWYNAAPIMCERNNHGHAVLLWLKSFGAGVRRLFGHDHRPGTVAAPGVVKEGWLSSTLGKTLLYDRCADAFKSREVVLHSFSAFTQLSSIDGGTLSAPPGQHDDRADGFALAVVGRLELARGGGSIGMAPPRETHDDEPDERRFFE